MICIFGVGGITASTIGSNNDGIFNQDSHKPDAKDLPEWTFSIQNLEIGFEK
jgi:hypothetical protein